MNLKALTFERLTERVNQLTLRERLILLLLGLAATWTLVDSLLAQPARTRIKAVAAQTAEVNRRIEAASQALAEIGGRADPDADMRRRLAAARHQYQARLDALPGLRTGLIPAREMATLLEGLIADYPGLRLVALKSLPPEPLGATAGQPAGPAALYRHGIELEVAGSYTQLTGFLRRAEQLPRRAFWAGAELNAERHPQLRLKLRLHTLSEEEAWLAL